MYANILKYLHIKNKVESALQVLLGGWVGGVVVVWQNILNIETYLVQYIENTAQILGKKCFNEIYLIMCLYFYKQGDWRIIDSYFFLCSQTTWYDHCTVKWSCINYGLRLTITAYNY